MVRSWPNSYTVVGTQCLSIYSAKKAQPRIMIGKTRRHLITDRGVHSSIMRGWPLRDIARGPDILIFLTQLGDLPLQGVNLAPLRCDYVVQFSNQPILMRGTQFQSVEPRRTV